MEEEPRKILQEELDILQEKKKPLGKDKDDIVK